MSDYEFDIPMPKEHAKLLLNILELAKKNNVFSVHYSFHPAQDRKSCRLQFDIGDITTELQQLPEDPLPGFEVLGLVKFTEESRVFLTPKAFKWAAYQKKSRLGKWWARLPGNVKDVMIFISFILSLVGVIISSYLAYLQILERLKPVP